MVPGERFELPTNGLQNRCSTAELTRLFYFTSTRYVQPPDLHFRHCGHFCGLCIPKIQIREYWWCNPSMTGCDMMPQRCAVDLISIADQVTWSFIPGKCLCDLTYDPLRGRMRWYVDPDKFSAGQPDDDKDVEQLESDARSHEQVHGGDLRRVVAKEGKPSLRRGGGSPNHVLRHTRLSDFETELQHSPWIRGAPHNGLSTLICRINARSSASIGGRPLADRDFQRQ